MTGDSTFWHTVDWQKLGWLALELIGGGYAVGLFFGQGLAVLLGRSHERWGVLGGLIFGAVGLGGVIGVFAGMVFS